MQRFLYLGETTWRVEDSSPPSSEYDRFLGELRAVPRGAREPGDWFVLVVPHGPDERRWTLVAVDSVRTTVALAEAKAGAWASRSRSWDTGAGSRQLPRRDGEPDPGGAAPPALNRLPVAESRR